MKPLNLREYGESLRVVGHKWGDAIIEAAEAQETIDRAETLDDRIRTALEESGCVKGEAYETLAAVQALAARDEAIAAFIEQQDENVWHDADKRDLPARLIAGVTMLREYEQQWSKLTDYLRSVGAIDETSDVLATIRLLIG